MPDETRKLPPARRSSLEQAATPDGFDWLAGNRVHGAACNWLFRKKLVAWGHANRKQVVIATPAGRSALAAHEEGRTDGLLGYARPFAGVVHPSCRL